MSGDSSLELQKGIYSALTGDGPLMAAIEGVFDWAPDQTLYPYVSIGDDMAVDWSACDFSGKEITATIHTWSRANGRKEVKTIQAMIKGLLHRKNMSFTGSTLVLLSYDSELTTLDPDGVTYHGVQRFTAITQEA